MEFESPSFDFNDYIGQYKPENDWSDYRDLMKAIERGNEICVLELLAQGGRVVKSDSPPSATPLHLAVEKTGWGCIVNKLLERGAIISMKNEKGNTALHHAFLAETSNTEVYIDSMLFNYLIKEGNANLMNADGLSFLHIATAKSKLTYIRDLLSAQGVDVNGQTSVDSKSDYAGFTALHFAVDKDRADVAACLLNRNASIYMQDANGMTPLHLALYRNNIGMIDLLLGHDPEYVNAVDNFGMSHFMAACMCNDRYHAKQYLRVAETYYSIPPTKLTNTSIDSNGKQFEGYTPLHFAVQWNRLQTVHLLLSYGADCCASTPANVTPHTLAKNLPLPEVGNVLNDYCEFRRAQMSIQTTNQVAECQAIPKEYWSAPGLVTSIDIKSTYPTYSCVT